MWYRVDQKQQVSVVETRAIVADASTQADLDTSVTVESSGSVGSAEDISEEIVIEEASRKTDHDAGADNEEGEDISTAGSTSTLQENLLSLEMAAHEQTRKELAQLQAQLTNKNNEVATYQRLLEETDQLSDNLQAEQTALQQRLDDADLQIAELQLSEQTLKSENEALQSEVKDLSGDVEDANDRIDELEESINEHVEALRGRESQIAGLNYDCMRMLCAIGIGRREFIFFVRLSSWLYACVNHGASASDSAGGKIDHLMRLTARRLAVYVPVEVYVRDSSGEVEERGPQLENEETSADHPALHTVEGNNVADIEGEEIPIYGSGYIVDEEIEIASEITTATADVCGVQAVEENIGDEKDGEGNQGGSAGVSFSNQDATCHHTSTTHPPTPKVQERAQESKSKVDAPLFGASNSGNPDSGSFSFTPTLNFNFGATTAFKSGVGSSKSGSKSSGDVKKDEQKESGKKKMKSASLVDHDANSGSTSFTTRYNFDFRA